MKLYKAVKPKPKTVVPVHSGKGYKCTCGNRLTGYEQLECELCGAVIDWEQEYKGFQDHKNKIYGASD